MLKLSKIDQIKYKKQLLELIKLGQKHDKEKDPVKKAELAAEIERRCNNIKQKVGTQAQSQEGQSE